MKESRYISKRKVAASVAVLSTALAAGWGLKSVQVTAQGERTTPVTTEPVVATPATRDAATMQSAFNDVAKAVEPAVVTIVTEAKRQALTSQRSPGTPSTPSPFGGDDPFEEFFKRFREFGQPNGQPNSYREDGRGGFQQNDFQLAQRGGGLGSGMIYREDGLILTNAHVVQNAEKVTVRLVDGREFKDAKVLGTDPRTDVAVVKINASNLPVVKLADSSKVNVGDWAIAIGNPFSLEHTLTVGVISATAREIDLSLNQRGPGDYLQTDASINPGNSGGPLCDIYGRVVGVNNAIYSQSGGNVGIGFAIPINTARDIADRLLKSPNGRIQRGYLGIGINELDEQKVRGLGLPTGTQGVLVETVGPDTPGSRAGLQEGDVILKFNGQAVTKPAELQRLVGDAPVNSEATLSVLRGDQNLSLKARLDELKDTEATPKPPTSENNEALGQPSALGLTVVPVTPQRARRNGLDENVKGVLVAAVAEGSPAAEAGIRAGDLIDRVGRVPVTSADALKNAVDALLKGQTGDEKVVLLHVNSRGQERFVTVTIEKSGQ